MNPAPEEAVRQACLRFHGRIVAGATHEFQNHLAVIKEYNGLVRDLLQAGRKVDKKTLTRCIEISRSIEDRAVAAAAAVEVLNGFAHRTDTAVSRFPADMVVKELISLMNRAAAQQKISMQVATPDEPIRITSNPAMLQYVLYLVVDSYLAILPDGSIISVSLREGDQGAARIDVSAKAEGGNNTTAPLTSDDGVIARCLQELGASIESGDPRGSGLMTTLVVPSSPAGD